MRGADLRAYAASATESAIQNMCAVLYSVCMIRANGETRAATDAGMSGIEKLGLLTLRLGIVTPRATEGATLQKDGRADSRAVVNAKFLDIEDNSHAYLFHKRQ